MATRPIIATNQIPIWKRCIGYAWQRTANKRAYHGNLSTSLHFHHCSFDRFLVYVVMEDELDSLLSQLSPRELSTCLDSTQLPIAHAYQQPLPSTSSSALAPLQPSVPVQPIPPVDSVVSLPQRFSLTTDSQLQEAIYTQISTVA